MKPVSYLLAVTAGFLLSSGCLAADPAINCQQFGTTEHDTHHSVTRYALARAVSKDLYMTSVIGYHDPSEKPDAHAGDLLIVTDPPVNDTVVAYKVEGKIHQYGCVPASSIRMIREEGGFVQATFDGGWTKIQPHQYIDDSIDINLSGDVLKIEGNAYWFYKPKEPNYGEMKGETKVNRRSITFNNDGAEDEKCLIKMQLVGPYLVVDDYDAEMCNGQNVDFTGVYRKNGTDNHGR